MPDRIGIQFLDRPGARTQLELVARADQLGYTSAWVAETRLTRDAVSMLGAFTAVTDRIQLGAAVVNTWTRGPVLTALTFATLHELAPGRIALGLGSYSDDLARRQGIERARPLTQLREYVEVVRALLRCESPVSSDGALVRVHDAMLDLGHGVPPEPIDVPIYLGATGLRTMELAGEVADGVLLNGFLSSDYTRLAMEHVAAGAVRAGRPPDGLDCPQLINVAMSDDRAEAVALARRMVAMYLGGQSHIARAAGIDVELAERLAEMVGGWPPTEDGVRRAERLVDADIVERLVVAGTPSECRSRLQDWVAAGASYPVISPISDNVAAICEAFAPSRS